MTALEEELAKTRERRDVDLASHSAIEAELVCRQLEFLEVIELLPQVVTICGEDGVILYANPCAARALQVPRPEELSGTRLADLLHPEDAARLHAVRGGRGVERRVRRRDGSYAILEVMVERPTSFEQSPAVLTVAADVTEARELERRLQVADRMASVGTLAAGVAHEINNPLAYVISNLGFAREAVAPVLSGLGPELASEVRAALDQALEGAERVKQIVRGLKTFSRVDGPVNGPVDLVAIASDAIEMCMTEVRHRATLERELSPVPHVLGNAGRLTQVVVNLVVNAAQAIPEGAVAQHRIRVRTELQGEHVVLSVQDTGSGISRENLSRIFDPFFTTKPVGYGTGLGLPICHGIVTDVGGRIEVESELGKGSTFRVLLPVHKAEAAPAPTPRAETPAPLTRRRVLVIDDDPSVAKGLARMLRTYSDAVTVESAREALALLQKGEVFDAAICDLMMPDMSGIEFIEELKRLGSPLVRRTVVATGGAFTEQARAFLDRGEAPVLEKPFTRDDVLAALAKLDSAG